MSHGIGKHSSGSRSAQIRRRYSARCTRADISAGGDLTVGIGKDSGGSRRATSCSRRRAARSARRITGTIRAARIRSGTARSGRRAARIRSGAASNGRRTARIRRKATRSRRATRSSASRANNDTGGNLTVGIGEDRGISISRSAHTDHKKRSMRRSTTGKSASCDLTVLISKNSGVSSSANARKY